MRLPRATPWEVVRLRNSHVGQRYGLCSARGAAAEGGRVRGAPWLAGEPRTSARAWQPRSPGPKEATQARVPCRHRPNVGAEAPIGGLQWVPTAPTPPRGCASPTAAPGGHARSGEVGRHQRKAAHACAEFMHRCERRWSCSPPPPLRACSWPASAGALLISIERKNPGAVGQHALGVAGPAEPLGAALRGQEREQSGVPRNDRHKLEFLRKLRAVLCLLCLY